MPVFLFLFFLLFFKQYGACGFRFWCQVELSVAQDVRMSRASVRVCSQLHVIGARTHTHIHTLVLLAVHAGPQGAQIPAMRRRRGGLVRRLWPQLSPWQRLPAGTPACVKTLRYGSRTFAFTGSHTQSRQDECHSCNEPWVRFINGHSGDSSSRDWWRLESRSV